jgi:hypothetical protein
MCVPRVCMWTMGKARKGSDKRVGVSGSMTWEFRRINEESLGGWPVGDGCSVVQGLRSVLCLRSMVT